MAQRVTTVRCRLMAMTWKTSARSSSVRRLWNSRNRRPRSPTRTDLLLDRPADHRPGHRHLRLGNDPVIDAGPPAPLPVVSPGRWQAQTPVDQDAAAGGGIGADGQQPVGGPVADREVEAQCGYPEVRVADGGVSAAERGVRPHQRDHCCGQQDEAPHRLGAQGPGHCLLFGPGEKTEERVAGRGGGQVGELGVSGKGHTALRTPTALPGTPRVSLTRSSHPNRNGFVGPLPPFRRNRPGSELGNVLGRDNGRKGYTRGLGLIASVRRSQ